MHLTRAEQSKYTETSLHADVMAFYAALVDPRIHVTTFGASPGGRELRFLRDELLAWLVGLPGPADQSQDGRNRASEPMGT